MPTFQETNAALDQVIAAEIAKVRAGQSRTAAPALSKFSKAVQMQDEAGGNAWFTADPRLGGRQMTAAEVTEMRNAAKKLPANLPTWASLSSITNPAQRWAAAKSLLATGQAQWGLGADPNNPGEYGSRDPLAGVDSFNALNSPTIKGYRAFSPGGENRWDGDYRNAMTAALIKAGAIYDPSLHVSDRTYYLPTAIAEQKIASGEIPTPIKDPNDTGSLLEKVVLGTIAAIAGAPGGLGTGLSNLTGIGAGANTASGLNALNSFDTGAMNAATSTASATGTGGRTLAEILNAGAGDIATNQMTPSPLGTVASGSLQDIANIASGNIASNQASTVGGLSSLVSGAGNVASTAANASGSTAGTGAASGTTAGTAAAGTAAAGTAAAGGGAAAGTGAVGTLANLVGGSSNLDTLGRILGTGLGMYASDRAADNAKELANQFASYGAPYRQKLTDLYANPSSFLNSQEVQKPVQMATDIMSRSLSTQGNPTGSGNALQQLQSYSADQLFGKLGQEKDRLAGYGGLANYNAAAPAAAANAGASSSNVYNALGAGIADIFSPPRQYGSLYDLINGRRP